MKEKLKKRLGSRAGETIAEVLISLLIAALSLTMLATMISATVNMVNTSKAKMKDYYDAIAVLEQQNTTGGSVETVAVSIKTSDNKVNETVSGVTLYPNEVFEKHVYAYKK